VEFDDGPLVPKIPPRWTFMYGSSCTWFVSGSTVTLQVVEVDLLDAVDLVRGERDVHDQNWL
jgi:hypothetical protein